MDLQGLEADNHIAVIYKTIVMKHGESTMSLLLQRELSPFFLYSLYLKCAYTHTVHTCLFLGLTFRFESADPTAPNVVVTRLTLVCETAPGPITMDLTGKWAHLCCSKGTDDVIGETCYLSPLPAKWVPEMPTHAHLTALGVQSTDHA